MKSFAFLALLALFTTALAVPVADDMADEPAALEKRYCKTACAANQHCEQYAMGQWHCVNN